MKSTRKLVLGDLLQSHGSFKKGAFSITYGDAGTHADLMFNQLEGFS